MPNDEPRVVVERWHLQRALRWDGGNERAIAKLRAAVSDA